MQAQAHLNKLRRELALTRFRLRAAALDPSVSTEEWAELLVKEELIGKRLQIALEQMELLRRSID